MPLPLRDCSHLMDHVLFVAASGGSGLVRILLLELPVYIFTVYFLFMLFTLYSVASAV